LKNEHDNLTSSLNLNLNTEISYEIESETNSIEDEHKTEQEININTINAANNDSSLDNRSNSQLISTTYNNLNNNKNNSNNNEHNYCNGSSNDNNNINNSSNSNSDNNVNCSSLPSIEKLSRTLKKRSSLVKTVSVYSSVSHMNSNSSILKQSNKRISFSEEFIFQNNNNNNLLKPPGAYSSQNIIHNKKYNGLKFIEDSNEENGIKEPYESTTNDSFFNNFNRENKTGENDDDSIKSIFLKKKKKKKEKFNNNESIVDSKIKMKSSLRYVTNADDNNNENNICNNSDGSSESGSDSDQESNSSEYSSGHEIDNRSTSRTHITVIPDNCDNTNMNNTDDGVNENITHANKSESINDDNIDNCNLFHSIESLGNENKDNKENIKILMVPSSSKSGESNGCKELDKERKNLPPIIKKNKELLNQQNQKLLSFSQSDILFHVRQHYVKQQIEENLEINKNYKSLNDLSQYNNNSSMEKNHSVTFKILDRSDSNNSDNSNNNNNNNNYNHKKNNSDSKIFSE